MFMQKKMNVSESYKQRIAVLEAEVKKYKRLMREDELTKILNRRGFLHETEKLFREIQGARATRERRKHGIVLEDLCVLLFDIDHFKKLNDIYGHEMGDAALKFFAFLVRHRLRASDVFARWGGEEFVVALPFTRRHDAAALAEEIRTFIEERGLKYRNRIIHITVSIGVAAYRNDAALHDLIRRADAAMYQAKQHGRNQVRVAE